MLFQKTRRTKICGMVRLGPDVGYYSTPVLSLIGDPGKQNSESLEMKSAEGIHCRANLAIGQEKRAVLVHLWTLQNTGGAFDSFF